MLQLETKINSFTYIYTSTHHLPLNSQVHNMETHVHILTPLNTQMRLN